jgi:uncharacterized DUF497 family protein
VAREIDYKFEWDSKKAAKNNKKHGLSFNLAATVFSDPLMLSIPDVDHSDDEKRWITMGQVENGKIVVVVHTFDENIESHWVRLRIISARFATKREIRQYETRT